MRSQVSAVNPDDAQSLDLSGGIRLWREAEFHVDGLFWQGFAVSDASGIAGVINGISIEHREFMAVGGTGITTGDAALNCSRE